MEAEDQLIDKIKKILRSSVARRRGSGRSRLAVELGTGDDAAVLSPSPGRELIVTCDTFLEGIHFLRDLHPADSVGYKSLARATSDIAAMGGRPSAFLLTLALPEKLTGAWLDRFLAGMKRAARNLHVQLIGGDTTKSPRVFISITVLGEAPHGQLLARSDARPGDAIYVSGRLGRAQLGLELVQRKLTNLARRDRASRAAVQQHLYPTIRVELGAWLAKRRIASAMMDISDGLSIDLPRLCRASGVGARIDAWKIPCVQIPERFARKLNAIAANPLHLALDGGEDYELLFTVPRRNVTKLRAAPGFAQLTAIGEITRDRKFLLVDPSGRVRPLRSRGWDPFRK